MAILRPILRSPLRLLLVDVLDRYGVGEEVVLPSGAFQYLEYDNATDLVDAETIYYQGIYEVRRRIVGTVYHIDITLNSTGFDGTENVSWTNLFKYNGQDAVFRSGVRGGVFVVDCEITGTGFAGDEDVDWEWLNKASGGGALNIFRDGIRSRAYVIDKVLTGTGFAGTVDVDWENVRTIKNN